jgi:hypothetical protein
MANIITAGNSTNGGTAISTDTSGTLNIVTGSGSGANAITIDASQAVTMPGTLAVTGAQTVGGNLTVTGTLSASGGVTGSLKSGTSVASTSGTSIDFTSLPTGLKRITVMFNGVSTNGTSIVQVQLGDAGGIESTGYLSSAGIIASSTVGSTKTSTTGLVTDGFASAVNVRSGLLVIASLGSNSWCISGNMSDNAQTQTSFAAGAKTLSATLDRVRITTVNGTDTFDAGTINILYE